MPTQASGPLPGLPSLKIIRIVRRGQRGFWTNKSDVPFLVILSVSFGARLPNPRSSLSSITRTPPESGGVGSVRVRPGGRTSMATEMPSNDAT